MEFQSYKNQWLTVGSNIKLTEVTDKVIVQLDRAFEEAKLKAVVTSVLRLAEDQMRIIRQYLVRTKLSKKYPEALKCGVDEKDADGNYVWQMGWSALLNAGVIVNPPRRAKVLMDYIRGGVNRKGTLINESPHFRGTAFDVGGGSDTIDNELKVIQKAIASGKIKGLVGILAEHNNNAVHCDCR
jgi:hypothetical protein